MIISIIDSSWLIVSCWPIRWEWNRPAGDQSSVQFWFRLNSCWVSSWIRTGCHSPGLLRGRRSESLTAAAACGGHMPSSASRLTHRDRCPLSSLNWTRWASGQQTKHGDKEFKLFRPKIQQFRKPNNKFLWALLSEMFSFWEYFLFLQKENIWGDLEMT